MRRPDTKGPREQGTRKTHSLSFFINAISIRLTSADSLSTVSASFFEQNPKAVAMMSCVCTSQSDPLE